MTSAATVRSVGVLAGLTLVSPLSLGCGGAKAPPTVDAASGRDGRDVAIPKDGRAAIGAKVFDESQVQSYYLTFSDEEYARLIG